MAQQAGTISTIQVTSQTLDQRGANAARDLRDALQIPGNLTDANILGAALAEAAVREVRRNPQFANDIRQRYAELSALRGSGAKGGGGKRASGKLQEPLVALRHLDINTIDPYAPPNPKDLIYVYGQDKLDRALQDYTLDMLKQTSAMIEAAHPGTKPRSKASKQSVIDYIVQYSRLSD